MLRSWTADTMITSERLFEMAQQMDARWAELDFYRQEVENLLEKAHGAVGTKLAESLALHGNAGYDDLMPEILHSTVWVFTTSFLEVELCRFAKALGDALRLRVEFGDLRGTWYERFRKYVELAELPLDAADDDWDDVRGIVEVRNCLVHNAGQLLGFPRRSIIEALCSRHSRLTIRDGALQLTSASSIVVMGVGGAFLGHSYDAAYEMLCAREGRQAWPRELNREPSDGKQDPTSG